MRFKQVLVVAATLWLWPGAVPSAGGQEALGDFYLFERTDPDTGEDQSSLTTLAEENYVSGTGGLTFRCTDEGLEMVLSATYLGRKMSTPVRFAFGEESPSRASWTLRSSGMAAIAPDAVRDEFIQRAVDETVVTFYASDFQLRSHTYTFHITGLEEGLARLSCD